ncbi:glycosyl hydrolase family 8 [Falsigemmobacter faecalis]|uniref:cellulase n=1 Tax=Falsigemmobacter faecalis TaxID=2488730 RepID=A0A3P3DVH2_9RHOB|nr:glycosyl hydrolase family 8 [Falsigemmobacter faecalis]RRH78169.1 glycosyl hydrolase family 5 [Falsigemmobacter faecalis]
MKRRHFLTSTATFAALSAAGLRPGLAQSPGALPMSDLFLAADHPLQEAWATWKTLCLTPEGRVVDGFQDNVSHSEGQGYGLVMAAIFGDRATADRIIGWTAENLAVRPDSLLAWRWNPASTPPVSDRNNASDGDLFYAWGLVLCAQRDNRPDLLEAATRIAADLLRRCTVPHPDGSARRLMLPGAAGFREAGVVVVNPSYYMPRAMTDLARATGQTALDSLAADGQALIATLTAQGPVPDWVQISAAGTAPPPAQFSKNAGYEAVRVALFQIWSGLAEGPAVRAWAAASEAAGPAGGAVTVWSLPDGAVLERSSHEGYAAVAALARCTASGGFGAQMPAFTGDQPYYPATLHLMALVAQATTYPRCVPI